MKKVLALVLALAMILGCFSFVSAAEFTDVAKDADYHDAAAVLSDLGVASGYTDGTFKPEKVVTRAEMAAFIVKALGIAPAASATTTFSDVPASHWASGYIAYATSLGIVSGYTDGTFKPDQTVSYDQAITMLVQALGYTADSLNGTYPAAYVSKAKALGLLEDVEALGTAGANRGDVAQLLYNTLDQYIGHVDKDGYWQAYDDTMFGRLGAEIMYGGSAFVVDTDDVDDADIDIAAYLGAYVTAYENDGAIVAIYEVKTPVTKMVYDKDNTKLGGYKLSKATLSKEFMLLKNGEEISTSGASIETLKGMMVDDVEYAIAAKTSGNYITTVYSFAYWEAKTTIMLDEDDIESIADNDKDSKLAGYGFNINNKDVITGVTVTGCVDSLDKLAEDMVVTLYLDKTNKIIKIEAADKTVTGKITKMTKSKYTVDGTAYDFSDATQIGTAFTYAFDTEYKLFFNAEDEVAFVEKVAEEEKDDLYAVLVDASYSEAKAGDWASEAAKLENTTRQVKLFTAEGETKVFTVAGKLNSAKTGFKYVDGFTSKTALTLDKVYKYTLNADGEVETLTAVTYTKDITTATEVKDNVTLDAKYFAKDAIVFVQTEDDSVYSYKVVAASSLTGKEVKGGYVASKTIEVLFVTDSDSAESDDVFAVYTGEWFASDDDEYTLSFLVEGVAKELTFDAKLDDAIALKLVSIKTAGDDELSTVAAVSYTDKDVVTGGSIDDDTNTYYTKKADKTVDQTWAIAEDAVIYIVEDDEVVSNLTKDKDGKAQASFKDLADEDNTAMYFFEPDDDAYTIVVIER